ncbi:hypothetical protein HDU89_008410 [Geranomyces variabilis]|nr:hypothetical protein HDU89_008410 [Geranomyces variabilis]
MAAPPPRPGIPREPRLNINFAPVPVAPIPYVYGPAAPAAPTGFNPQYNRAAAPLSKTISTAEAELKALRDRKENRAALHYDARPADLAKDVTRLLLSAAANPNDRPARALVHFPDILALCKQSGQVFTVFKQYVMNVPSRYILPWLPDILNFDNKGGSYHGNGLLHHNVGNGNNGGPATLMGMKFLLQKLATDFPQEVFLRIACRTDLQILCKDTLPESQARELLSHTSLDPNNVGMGTQARTFATKNGQTVAGILGRNCKNLLSPNPATVTKALQALVALTPKKPPAAHQNVTVQLTTLSPYLAAYRGSLTSSTTRFQIPGTNPPKYLKRFSTAVTVLTSIRRPKIITMIDFQNGRHKFLFKAGDDLRVDEIVNRTFHVMQELIDTDTECAKHNIQFSGHMPDVFAFSSFFGLVEWVPSTTLMDAIESSPNATTEIAASSSAWAAYLNGLAPPQVPAGADIYERTRATYQMVSAPVAAAWAALALRHPHLLAFLRAQEANPALTPAQQAAFHENFTKSYAVMTLILWILGVGDRHLGNFLITPTGFLIPIDYDLVMGRGQMTPVPDVVPVRCTDQIERAINLPYVKGIMVDVMRAFQSYRNTIMRSLELLKVVPPRDTLALKWDGRRGFAPNGEAAMGALFFFHGMKLHGGSLRSSGFSMERCPTWF